MCKQKLEGKQHGILESEKRYIVWIHQAFEFSWWFKLILFEWSCKFFCYKKKFSERTSHSGTKTTDIYFWCWLLSVEEGTKRERDWEGEKNEGLLMKTKSRPLSFCDLFSFLEKFLRSCG